MNELLSILDVARRAGPGNAALATLVKVEGSSYRLPGARLVLTRTEAKCGRISGGCLEADVLRHLGEVLESGTPRVVTYDTRGENDLVWGVGLGCHGTVTLVLERLDAPEPLWRAVKNAALRRESIVLYTGTDVEGSQGLGTRLTPLDGGFVHRILPPVRVTVFGADDDAQPLVALGATLGWDMAVVDPRPTLANAVRFPGARDVVCAPLADSASLILEDERSFAVVMTHRYAHDAPILRQLLVMELPYIGLLGPRERAARLVMEMRRDGFEPAPERLARLHAPVGLDLGGDNPATIALAICAEIQAVLTGRDGRPLRERDAPIHGER